MKNEKRLSIIQELTTRRDSVLKDNNIPDVTDSLFNELPIHLRAKFSNLQIQIDAVKNRTT